MIIKFALMFVSFISILEGSSKYPVDISFLVADLKYSEENGIKICEIQHGILSTFYGDAFLNGSTGYISQNFHHVLSEFPIKKWSIAMHISSWNIVLMISKALDWKLEPSLNSILNNEEFINLAKIQPKDPLDLSSYHGILFVRSEEIKEYEKFKNLYPGIILVDAANSLYWVDKYKMSQLFERDPKLSAIKPEWKLYYKKDLETLAQDVMNDIQSEWYVIKPRGAFLGNGVIIVARDELDSTFQSIFSKKSALLDSADKSYNYWKKDSFDSFIVEKFYPSDLVSVPELNGRVYDPTIRAAFILIYNKGEIEFKMLGSYGLLPYKPVDEKGSLNDCHKAYCKEPFFTKLSDRVTKQVEKQLGNMMPLFYEKMLMK